jgi:hypothetical protein
VSVMIGMAEDTGTLPVQTVNSLLGTLFACAQAGVPCELSITSGSSIVQYARSYVGHRFLASKAERLFMIDSDVAWKPQDFLRLLELSQHMDVVCAACPQKKDPAEFMLKSVPREANEHGCYRIDGIGLAFVVVHRRVMEALAERSPKVVFVGRPGILPYLFRCDINHDESPPSARGEDMAFFADLRDMGFQVWLDPRTTIGHIGPKMYVGSIEDAIKQAQSL